LPSEDPQTRYAEACRRFDEAVRAVGNRGEEPTVAYAGLYGILRTPEQVVGDVLTIEGELAAGGR
jgi:hypothetical protein